MPSHFVRDPAITEARLPQIIDFIDNPTDTDGTRNKQAVPRTRQRGFFVPVIYRIGRVERRNTTPVCAGNMPGASCLALVDTRLPATNWRLLTKINKEGICHA